MKKSRNSLYSVPRSKTAVHHVQTLVTKHTPEAINNVDELPSIEQTIRYLHAEAGFPTKSTWIKSIQRGKFLTWPLINIKNVTKSFPEYEEIQKGHIRGKNKAYTSPKLSNQ